MGAEAVNGELGQVPGLPGREALGREAEGKGKILTTLRDTCFFLESLLLPSSCLSTPHSHLSGSACDPPVLGQFPGSLS